MSRAHAGDYAPGSNQRGLAGYFDFTDSRGFISRAGGCSVAVDFPSLDLPAGPLGSAGLSGP